MDCHDPASKLGKSYPLTKEGLTDPAQDLIKIGDPENSDLIISLEQKTSDDPVPMPPAKKGYAPLNPKELQSIKDWITNGAKD